MALLERIWYITWHKMWVHVCHICEQRLEPGYELQLGDGFHDPNLAVVVTQGDTEEVSELMSDHEEADSSYCL